MSVIEQSFSDLMSLEKFLKTGIISESTNGPFFYTTDPFEGIFVNTEKLKIFRKVPELTKYINFEDIKLLEVINNKFIPIYDMQTKELVFSAEDFTKYRKKMSGIKTYGTGNFEFSENLYFPKLDYYLEQIDENMKHIDEYRKKVITEVTKILTENGFNVTIGCNSAGDVELVEAGSTARYTNVPNADPKKNLDFDFTVRFDQENTWKIKEILENNLLADVHITQTSAYKVRLVGVKIPGLDRLIDLDFSLTPQKEKYFPTEDAISERLENIREVDEEKYRLVLANIMYAKDLLKQAGCYKPSRGILSGNRQNGGLGGIGVENWVLQNGGSIIDASVDFLSYANGKDFKDFEKEYAVMDFGANHVEISKHEWPYDNFVINNMRYLGYEKMREALNCFINQIDYSLVSNKQNPWQL